LEFSNNIFNELTDHIHNLDLENKPEWPPFEGQSFPFF
jgi:hypothetical protein